jgi:hypothetical protein
MRERVCPITPQSNCLSFLSLISDRVFFTREFSSNFNVKIRILTYVRDFSWEHGPHSPDFKTKKSKLLDLYDKFKEYRRIFIFLKLSYLVCSKLVFAQLPFSLHHKIFKRNPHPH